MHKRIFVPVGARFDDARRTGIAAFAAAAVAASLATRGF
jgi:hypothetical protein